jgi:hypothetical protein
MGRKEEKGKGWARSLEVLVLVREGGAKELREREGEYGEGGREE